MVSQQASSRFLKIAIEGKLMAKCSNLFYSATLRIEKQLFDELYENSDDATSGGYHEGENKKVE